MIIWTVEIKELEKLSNSFKGNLPEIEKELKPLITTQDANVVMLYSRRCLEVIVTDLCEIELKRPRKTEPLQGIIDKLKKENFVPENIAISMTSLNSLSNLGTHPKDFDPEQIKPVLNNLAIVLKWYLKYKDYSDTDIKKPEGVIKIGRSTIHKAHSFKLLKRHYFSFAVVVLVIIAFIFQKSITREIWGFSEAKSKMVIAVMPFKNMTNDTLWNVWQEGIQINLLSALTNTKDFKVRQLELTNNFLRKNGARNLAALTPEIASIISQKLEAGLYVYGNILKSGNVIRLNAQLIDSKTREAVKSFQVEEIPIEDNILKIIDSLSIMIKNYLIMAKLEKENKQFNSYSTLPTHSPEAYRCFILGTKALYRADPVNAIQKLMESIKIDSNLYLAYGYISMAFYNLSYYPQAKYWMRKYYSKREMLDFKDRILADYLNSLLNGTPNERIRYIEQLQYIDDLDPDNYIGLGFNYAMLFQYDKAILNFEKAFKIYNKWDSIPIVYFYYGLGSSYQKARQYKKAEKLFRTTQKQFPDDLYLIGMYATLAFSERDTISGNKWLKTYIYKGKEQSMSEASTEKDMGDIYREAGLLNKAEEHYRKAFSLEPDNQYWMETIAYFLVEKNRNIDEGLELAEKLIKLQPNNFVAWQTKGFALLRKGSSKEALIMINKSWELRLQVSKYDHEAFLLLEEAKKAVARQN